jgi:hypothetical protein
VSEGDRLLGGDARYRRELASWLRPNRSRARDGMPGYAIGIGDVASYVGPLVVRTFDWGEGKAAIDGMIATGSPALLVLGTERDDAAAWLDAGQALEHVLLLGTSRGLSFSFLNQAVEVPALRRRLRDFLRVSTFPQLILRTGYAAPARATPRRPLDDVML